jgi:Ca2+-binding RTX toxin-like protein
MRGLSRMLSAATAAAAITAGAFASGAGAADSLAGEGVTEGAARDQVAFERLSEGAEQSTGVRSLQRLQATSSQFLNTYRLIGTAENDNFWVTITDSGRGRFIVRSRNRPITPIAPPLGCRVDSAHQVSCRPGLIESLVVRLKRGRDVFEATPVFRLPTFVAGGMHRDRLIAGNGPTVLRGNGGPDRLVGNRGTNRLFGGRGRDVIVTGPGRNIVKAGQGRDICIDNRRGDNTFQGCSRIVRR